MIRFIQVARVVSNTLQAVPIFSSRNFYNTHIILGSRRFYSKGKQPPKGPLYFKSDCTPPTRPLTCSAQLYQDSQKPPPTPPPPRKSTRPRPPQIEELSEKAYRSLLVLGISATLLTLGGLYYFSRGERQKRVAMHQKHQPAERHERDQPLA